MDLRLSLKLFFKTLGRAHSKGKTLVRLENLPIDRPVHGELLPAIYYNTINTLFFDSLSLVIPLGSSVGT